MSTELKDFHVSEPNLHDGTLEGLTVSDQNVALACRDSLKRRVTVWLVDVLHLKADNFRLGNIIFDLEIFPGLDCPEELLQMRQGLGRRGQRMG